MAGRASIVGAADERRQGARAQRGRALLRREPASSSCATAWAATPPARSRARSRSRRPRGGERRRSAVADSGSKGTPEARKQLLLDVIRERRGRRARRDHRGGAAPTRPRAGMGTTLVGAMVVGGDVVFAHAGDSRAYLVRDGIAMQLTEDHTLLARLLAAGVDVDTSGEGARFKSMLTNALGIGQECKVSTFVVPLADGDRFLLCSDGITEYVPGGRDRRGADASSRARRARRRSSSSSRSSAAAATTRPRSSCACSRPARRRGRPTAAQATTTRRSTRARCGRSCHAAAAAARAAHRAAARSRDGEQLPAQTLGDRVAWIIVEGEVEQDGDMRGPGALLYPEALLADRPLPDKDGLAVARERGPRARAARRRLPRAVRGRRRARRGAARRARDDAAGADEARRCRARSSW